MRWPIRGCILFHQAYDFRPSWARPGKAGLGSGVGRSRGRAGGLLWAAVASGKRARTNLAQWSGAGSVVRFAILLKKGLQEVGEVTLRLADTPAAQKLSR